MAKKKRRQQRWPTMVTKLIDESDADGRGEVDVIEELPQNFDPTPHQPRTSPYTDAPFVLHIGPDEIKHYVPRHLVPPNWMKTSLGNCFNLPDLDEETGHTLVHHLYTGTYETLHREVNSSTVRVCVELKQALVVYIMASNYNLPDIQKLAIHNIEDFAVGLSIFEILEVVKENFSKLGSDSMVHDYLRKRIKAAFEEDYSVFTGRTFLDYLGNLALNKFMTVLVMDLYHDKISQMLVKEKELPKTLEDCDQTTRGSSPEKTALDQNIAVQQNCIIPFAEETLMEERCGQEAHEQQDFSFEEFRTMSCPCSDFGTDIFAEEAIPDEIRELSQEIQLNKPPGREEEETTAGLEIETQSIHEIDQELESKSCPQQAKHMLKARRRMKCNLCKATLQRITNELS